MKSGPTTDDVNRNVYRRDKTIGAIQSREGKWIDRCERLILNEVADEFRGQPILDIGVGAGRTTWLLRLLSDKYIAVDLSPEMVETCRREHPGLDVRVADARDLSTFDPYSFSLVFFSFNGIDLLDRKDRLRAIDEIHRILKPGGLFLYSTGNKNGKGYDIRPGYEFGNPGFSSIARFLLHFPSYLSRYWRSYRNWRQKRHYAEDHGSWAIGTSCAYEFSCVVHWTRPSTEREALLSAGFTHCEFRSQHGIPITDDLTTSSYFYVMARKTMAR